MTAAVQGKGVIAFQGVLGANSHIACRAVYPDMRVLPCESFEDAFEAVESGKAELGMIPIENSTAGRVADIHFLLPRAKLHVIGEYFQPIHHCLMTVKGGSLQTIKEVYSHIQALDQCRQTTRAMGLTRHVFGDTAGAAEYISHYGNPEKSAIASSLAAEIYGLEILKENIEDEANNTTRFVVMSRNPNDPKALKGPVMTSFTFEVKNIPAALYKALGGFATNGVNMTKLESYQKGGTFSATEFYAEIDGCESSPAVKRAMEELRFHSKHVRTLGVYPQVMARGKKRG